jgi:hypothetical protein
VGVSLEAASVEDGIVEVQAVRKTRIDTVTMKILANMLKPPP